MTTLDLRDISTLTDLQAALGRFASGTQECLSAAEAEIRRTLEWLIERVHHWQREVERARREVARAEADLRQCEASGYRDRDGYYHRSDCSHEARVLARAVSYQQECEGNLRLAQAWRSRLEQAVDEYRREVRRLYDAAGGHTEQARAFLNKMAAKYAEVGAAASVVGDVLIAASVGVMSAEERLGARTSERIVADTSTATIGNKPPKNPYGKPGDPAHKAEVARLRQKAENEFPDDIIHEGDSIRGKTRIHRQPDVWVEDAKTHKVKKVYEAARTKPDGKFVDREMAKKAQYDAKGIPNEFGDAGPVERGGK